MSKSTIHSNVMIDLETMDNTSPATTDILDDEHPLWLINEQIKGLLEGEGASEDHENVTAFLLTTGLPDGTVKRMHRAIVFGDHRAVVENTDAANARARRIATTAAEDAVRSVGEPTDAPDEYRIPQCQADEHMRECIAHLCWAGEAISHETDDGYITVLLQDLTLSSLG